MFTLFELAVPIAAAAGGAAALWAGLERLYVPVPPNRALVLYGHRAVVRRNRAAADGSDASVRVPRILLGGGVYLAPWNRATATLSLAPIDVETSVRALHTLDGASTEGWEVAVQVQVKIPAEPRALRAAAENLLGLGEEELRTYVRRAVEGAVPPVLARVRVRDGEPDWERLASEIQAAVAPELVTAGLLVRSVSVKELRRIGPASRVERGAEPRRRTAWSPAPGEPAGRADAGEARLERVERGLRSIAAELARLLRDVPGTATDGGRWVELPPSERSDGQTHDSIADGRSPQAAPAPWRAEPDPEASP